MSLKSKTIQYTHEKKNTFVYPAMRTFAQLQQQKEKATVQKKNKEIY